jgi:hypothetical protein
LFQLAIPEMDFTTRQAIGETQRESWMRGWYEHRTITGGIGHNLPQEAPAAFAKAIIDVDKA